ncbi:MAG: RNA polymerase sigma factor [Polyangiaceae bacterium]|jgi:RNA polymerase sigma-70 factor (ECF subfamily)
MSPLPSVTPSAAERHKLARQDAEEESLEDERLVERACAGDRAAEETIYRRHVRFVSGLVMRLLVDPAETEDVVQDTFVLALEQMRRLRQGRALRAWLAQIAVSQARRRFRRRRLLRFLGFERGDPTMTLEAIASQDASPEVRSDLAALGKLLGELPVDQRIAWSLRHIEGCSLDEVAAACRCSLATAKRRIATADRHVRPDVYLSRSVVSLPGSTGLDSEGGR